VSNLATRPPDAGAPAETRPDSDSYPEVTTRPRDRSRVAITATAWVAADGIELREWAEQGRRLGVIGRSAGWWIGDWLRYGNAKFGERYVRAARITGYDVQTLMNMVYVASRFEPSRRRENLSWSHHAEVAAAQDMAEQERWLDHSESERLSVRCLREEMRRERRMREEMLGTQAELEGIAEESAADAEPGDHELVCPDCGCRFSQPLGVEEAPAP
jgi:hypothetical protein